MELSEWRLNGVLMEHHKTIKEVARKEPRLVISSGFLDTRFFTSAGCEAIAYGPGNLHRAHTANEYVETDKIITVSKVFGRLVEKLLLQ